MEDALGKLGHTQARPGLPAKGFAMSDAKFWARSCLGKKRYSTNEFVEKVRRDLEAKRGIQLRSYYCRQCMGFHLTKAIDHQLRKD